MPNKALTAGYLIDACYMYAINGKNLTKTDLKREIGRLELDDMFWIPTDSELLILITIKKQN